MYFTTHIVDQMLTDIDEMSDAQKVELLKQQFDNIVKNFTDDEGKIYWKTYNISFDQKEVDKATLEILDRVVENAANGESLTAQLMMLAEYAKQNLGAKSADYNTIYNMAVFKAEFESGEFKRCFVVDGDN